MIIEVNYERLEQLSIADLTGLIERFKEQIHWEPELRHELTQCIHACDKRITEIIEDIFIF